MQRQLAVLILLAVPDVVFLSLLHTSTVSAHMLAGDRPRSQGENVSGTEASSAISDPGDPRCSARSISDGWCGALEERLLESVVRLELGAVDEHGRWEAEIGHGTVMGGRYLVTHNHFDLRLSLLESEAPNFDASASLYRADGTKIWMYGEVVHFTIVVKDSQTLVLDFGRDDLGQGFFERHGLASASFRTLPAVVPERGDEVAKVDWADGRAYLEWGRVEDVRNESGTSIIAISKASQLGASGGGVFWQGHHIANNWASVEVFGAEGELVRRYSKAALNSDLILSLLVKTAP